MPRKHSIELAEAAQSPAYGRMPTHNHRMDTYNGQVAWALSEQNSRRICSGRASTCAAAPAASALTNPPILCHYG